MCCGATTAGMACDWMRDELQFTTILTTTITASNLSTIPIIISELSDQLTYRRNTQEDIGFSNALYEKLAAVERQ